MFISAGPITNLFAGGRQRTDQGATYDLGALLSDERLLGAWN